MASGKESSGGPGNPFATQLATKRRTAVVKNGRGTPRKPATKLPHLRKKLVKAKVTTRQVRKK
jgi:hypothetical protein